MEGVTRLIRRNEKLEYYERTFPLFFGWLCGVCSLLLGAPLIAIAKVVCDCVESLKPAGELLGR